MERGTGPPLSVVRAGPFLPYAMAHGRKRGLKPTYLAIVQGFLGRSRRGLKPAVVVSMPVHAGDCRLPTTPDFTGKNRYTHSHPDTAPREQQHHAYTLSSRATWALARA